jgi:toxin FitB
MGVRCRGPSWLLSYVTILEHKTGVFLAEAARSNGAVLRAWLDDHVLAGFLNAFCREMLRLLNATPNLQVADPRSDRDALMAATAFVHGMTAVTCNGAHCEPIGAGVQYPGCGEDKASGNTSLYS